MIEHYLPNFIEESIKALEADLKDMKEGKTDLAERYTEVLEADILAGIEKRKREGYKNVI